jgi:hypothetical protein
MRVAGRQPWRRSVAGIRLAGIRLAGIHLAGISLAGISLAGISLAGIRLAGIRLVTFATWVICVPIGRFLPKPRPHGLAARPGQPQAFWAICPT